MTAEDRRAIVHALTGLLAVSFRFLPWAAAAAFGLLLVAHNRWILPRILPEVVRGPTGRGPAGEDAGILAYPVAVTLAVLVFRDRLELAAAVWGILAFGDGAASLVGRRARRSLPWNPGKTWGGLGAFVLAGSPAAAALALWVRPGPWDPATIPGVLAVGVGASLLAGLAETLRLRLDDNYRIVAIASAALALLHALHPELLREAGPGIVLRFLAFGAATLALGALARRAGQVDGAGLAVGTLLAAALGALAGGSAYLAFVGFFVLAAAATRLGRATKDRRGLAQARGGRRGAAHAIANVGVAVALALGVAASDRPDWFRLGVAAALATAAFDTVSSEVGQARGGRTVDPVTFRRVPPGSDGGVSATGTLAGLAAAGAVGAVAVAGTHAGLAASGLVVLAAFVGTSFESVVASRPAVARLLDNHSLNFLNTAVGGGTALALAHWTGA